MSRTSVPAILEPGTPAGLPRLPAADRRLVALLEEAVPGAVNTTIRDRVVPELLRGSDNGRLPIVCDASSCTEGLHHMLQDAGSPASVQILDAVAFADEILILRLSPAHRLPKIAIHPTCSSVTLNLQGHLRRVAATVAEEVVIPPDWGCCGFAGDRGLLHPELTASATARESAAINAESFTPYASLNRTCELGMTRATGHPYRHILELLDDTTQISTDPTTHSAPAEGHN